MENFIKTKNYSSSRIKKDKIQKPEWEVELEYRQAQNLKKKEMIQKRIHIKDFIDSLPKKSQLLPEEIEILMAQLSFSPIPVEIKKEQILFWATENYINFQKLIYNFYLSTFTDCGSKIRSSKVNRSKFIKETLRRQKLSKKEEEKLEVIEEIINNFVLSNQLENL